MPNQVKAKRDGVIYPQIYNFSQFQHGKVWCSQTLRIKLPVCKSFLLLSEIIRTHRVQNSVSIWYVAALKLCVVIDSQVKIWYWTLFYKYCHQTPLCLPRHLVPFWKYLRTLITILILINRQHFNFQEMKSCVTLPSTVKSIAYYSFFGVKNLKAVEGLFMFFSVPQFDLIFFYLVERSASATYNIEQANCFVLDWFFFNKC